MDNVENMLKALTEASGVAGYEEEVRQIIRERLESCGEISQDRLGSLICRSPGNSANPVVMIAAHMDEIGFMVKQVTGEGCIRFINLGGWPNQFLPGHRVVIKTSRGRVTGTINMPPPHFLTQEERNKIVPAKDMFIDIGASSPEEVATAGVKPGDPIIPVSDFVVLEVSQKTYMAKAFDNRVGCGVAIEVMREVGPSHPNTLVAVATAQEEVGTRGATTSAEAVKPDLAIILDISPVGDTPGVKQDDSTNKIGAGPALLIYDPRMIPNLKLRDLVFDIAEELKVPLQICTMEFGGYDGDPLHKSGTGVPTVVIGIPTRHAHCHNSIIRRSDFDNTVKLVSALVQRLDGKAVQDLLPR